MGRSIQVPIMGGRDPKYLCLCCFLRCVLAGSWGREPERVLSPATLTLGGDVSCGAVTTRPCTCPGSECSLLDIHTLSHSMKRMFSPHPHRGPPSHLTVKCETVALMQYEMRQVLATAPCGLSDYESMPPTVPPELGRLPLLDEDLQGLGILL